MKISNLDYAVFTMREPAKPIWQGRGLKFSHIDRTFEINKLVHEWVFAWCLQDRNRSTDITEE